MPGARPMPRPVLPGLAGEPPAGRCLVMGVLNVTPDSFSDGGRWDTVDAAIDRGLALAAAGADIVDVGGESTRPGAERVPGAVERERTVPVVEALAGNGIAVSIDTMRAETAAACVEAGAVLVNDVSGGLADTEMLATVARAEVAYAAMHWRAPSDEMDAHAVYAGGVVSEVLAELGARRDAALAAGIPSDRLVLDPGLGFAKTAEQSWMLLRALDELCALGQPLMVGASRKRMLGAVLDAALPRLAPRAPQDREDAGVAVTALAAGAGAWAVRVHEAGSHRDAAAVAAAWKAGSALPPDRP